MSLIRINTDPTRRQLNQFGCIWLVFFLVIGYFLGRRFESTTWTYALWTLAAVIPLIGWCLPAFMRLVYLGMTYLAFPIGFVISHVLLALVYYGVLTPIGLAMRLFRYDPMQRRCNPAAGSYWQNRDGERDVESYFRQF